LTRRAVAAATLAVAVLCAGYQPARAQIVAISANLGGIGIGEGSRRAAVGVPAGAPKPVAEVPDG